MPEKSLDTLPITYKGRDVTDVELYYIGSEYTPSFKDMVAKFPQFQFTLRSLYLLAKENNWEEKRKEFVGSLTKQLKEKMLIKGLNNKIQVSNMGMNLLGEAYDKYSKTIKSDKMVVTAKDISMLGNMVLKASGQDGGDVNINKSKNLFVNLPKDPSDMTAEEINECIEAIDNADDDSETEE